MPPPELHPVTRQSVPEVVAAQLRDQILAGRLAVGVDLPGERALAETLGVSRPTVREALRRLQQQGLVEIRQGGATTVSDFRRTAGLDLLPPLLQPGGRLDVGLAADILRARSAIGPQVARAAADAAPDDPDGTAAVDRAARRVVATAHDHDHVAQQHAALAFWDAVVDLTGSMVYRLLFNGLRRAYEPVLEALAPVLAAEIGDGTRYTAVATAIAMADPADAQAAAEALLAAGHRAVGEVIAQFDRPDGPDPRSASEPGRTPT